MKRSKYILDPHSAIGVAAAYRSIKQAPPSNTHHITLATAHPAKVATAAEKALEGETDSKFEDLLPEQFVGIQDLPKRKTAVKKSDGIEGLRAIIRERVPASSPAVMSTE